MTIDLLNLAKESGVSVESYMTNPPRPLGIHFTKPQLEAFARSLLETAAKKCDANVVRASDWDSSYYDQASEQCGIAIRQMLPPAPEQAKPN